MKLIACYIENFGKYANEQFSFESGLTAYCLKNGEGKTTLAAFLRAMLYGMETDRGEAYGERSRYYPFQGGNYGGWLQVEWQQRTYKIIRTFDKKSAAKDMLSVLDERNRPCEDLGEIPGEKMFGINRQAFERTSYITWKQVEADLSGGVGQRLCGLVAEESSIGAEAAAKALDEYAKNYHSGRKKAGVYTGYIPETETKITETLVDIYAAQNAETELLSRREEYEQLRLEEADLTAKMDEMQAAGIRRTRWEQYELLLSSAREEEEKLSKLAKIYPKGFPTDDELLVMKAGDQEAMLLRQRLSDRNFGKEKELGESEAQFAASGVPTSEKMNTIERLVDGYLQTANEEAQTQPQPKRRTKPWKWISSFILSVLLAVMGVTYLDFNLPLGVLMIAFAIVGVVALAGGLFLKRPTASDLRFSPAASAELSQLKARLEDFFWQYGVRIGDFAAALRTLKADIHRLQTLRAEKEAYTSETEKMRKKLTACEDELKTLFEKYGLTEATWQEAGGAAKAYAQALRAQSEKAFRAEEYRVKYDVEKPTVLEEGNWEERKLRLRAVQEKLRSLSTEMRRLEEQISALPKLLNTLADFKETLQSLQEQKRLIELTAQSLRLADDRLKDTYLIPMQKSFLRFAKQMGAEWADAVSLDGDLKLFFEERGALRREEHFSDGQKALAALCMRLALLENMYRGEAPFCILDDPFVHLDETHLQEVSGAMKALSSSVQIVYFTCHHSRMLGL